MANMNCSLNSTLDTFESSVTSLRRTVTPSSRVCITLLIICIQESLAVLVPVHAFPLYTRKNSFTPAMTLPVSVMIVRFRGRLCFDRVPTMTRVRNVQKPMKNIVRIHSYNSFA